MGCGFSQYRLPFSRTRLFAQSFPDQSHHIVSAWINIFLSNQILDHLGCWITEVGRLLRCCSDDHPPNLLWRLSKRCEALLRASPIHLKHRTIDLLQLWR